MISLICEDKPPQAIHILVFTVYFCGLLVGHSSFLNDERMCLFKKAV